MEINVNLDIKYVSTILLLLSESRELFPPL